MTKVKELLITERELIERLSLITGHGKDIVRDVLKAQSELIIEEVKNGIPVRLGELGEFHPYPRMCQGGYDFKERKMKPRKEVMTIKFRCSAALKKAVHSAND